jgi:Ca-activated chloride channel family protein
MRIFFSRAEVTVLAVGICFWESFALARQAPLNQQAGTGSQLPAQKGQAPGKRSLEPVSFSPSGSKLKGWKVAIPGNRPLATPAVVDGRVFLGGGFGSHEFYAFDAVTGKKLWQYQTKDDGPTMAVVLDGHVAFNTESCEMEVITIAGKSVWKKWLGDPLMSTPAIHHGKLYMAYPDSKGDHAHHLACFDLASGKEFWKKKIVGEIITAPVVDNERVYVATLDGTLYCFGQYDGELLWKENTNATSSPTVWNGHCYFSRREEVVRTDGKKKTKQQIEQIAARGLGVKNDTSNLVATARSADYLDINKRVHSPLEQANQSQDAAVGFGMGGLGGSPGTLIAGGAGNLAKMATGKGDAKMVQALANLGQASVVGIWSYQGSRPFIYKGRLYSSMGDSLLCTDPKTEKVIWKKDLSAKKDRTEVTKELLDATLTPPVLVNEKVFLGTLQGEIICLSAVSGEILWRAKVGEPVAFQPAVVKGRVYIATQTGSLFCLETGDSKDDGWAMWGATTAHNGLSE